MKENHCRSECFEESLCDELTPKEEIEHEELLISVSANEFWMGFRVSEICELR